MAHDPEIAQIHRMDAPQAQAARAPVLMPALVPHAFDYLVPEGTPEGALVEAKLAGRILVGAVWQADAGAKEVPFAKLKPVTRVIETLPPLRRPFRDWLDWVSDFTLAPKGAVLSLCGLAHAAKTPKKAQAAQKFAVTLPVLTAAQVEVADVLKENASAGGVTLLDGVTGSGKTEVYFHAIAEAIARGEQVLVLLPEIALTHQWYDRFAKTFGTQPIAWHSRMTPAAKARAWQAIARGEVQVVVGARSALFLPFAKLGLIIVDEEHDPSYKQEDGVLYHARDMAVVRARFEQVPILLVSATPSLETLENVREGKYRALHLPERFGAAGMPIVRLVDMRNEPPERGDFLSPVVKREMLETLARGEQVLLFLNRRGYAPLLLCRGCGHRFQCANCSAWLVVHGKKGPGSWVLGSGKDQHPAPSTQHLACHHCGHKEPMPPACPACAAPAEKLAPCGPGVERIAEEVRGMFAEVPPGTPSPLGGEGWDEGAHLRFSSPVENTLTPTLSPEGRGSAAAFMAPPRITTLSSDESIAAETWADIEAGKIDIIVGTQMVAKGHHFPRLTLVVVVDADVGLSGADLRAGERTYQLLHQLGGRAGRGELAGRVLIQTYLPTHPVMESLLAHDRDRLMALEAKERRAGSWPPFGQLAAILLDGVDEAKVRAAGQMLARSAPADPRLTILGPAPAPLSRLRGQFRYRLLVKAKPGIHLQRTLRNWLEGQKFSGVRVKVDVNPYYFM